MTPKPFLIVQRLLVQGKGRTVYDEFYHAGINIIRGENHSGKSTICDMIFYILGGENIEWTDEAQQCDWVQAEICTSGMVFSLRRQIIKDDSPSIAVCEGPLSETMKTLNGWSNYGRVRSLTKESFSQFLFDRLSLPQTKSPDSQANVTVYQTLRLLYGDQNTDNTSLFRKERQPFADRQDVRRSVGEMLLGIDDLQGHDLRQQQIELNKILAQKKSRFESLLDAAEKADPNFRLTDYTEKISETKASQIKLDSFITETSAQTLTAKQRDKQAEDKIRVLEKELKANNSKISVLRTSVESLQLNIGDSEAFISSLKSDLNELLTANRAKNLIGQVTLVYCPICLSDISRGVDNCCPLCKSSTTGDSITKGRLRYEQELKHQINESSQILAARKQKLLDEERVLNEKLIFRSQNMAELRSVVDPSNQLDAKVSKLLKDFGYLTRMIEDLGRMESLQREVNSLEGEVHSARKTLEDIERRIRQRQGEQEDRRNYCQDRIGSLTIEILSQDVIVHETDTLRDAAGLVFSFEKDFLSVRHGRLSASTQAFLKDSFYLGLLKFSVEDEQCRLPNFFILDNIEDKGMTPERFRNFHHMLVDYSNSVKVPHQVILTTSYIDDALNNSQYCVGHSYDRPPYTLDLKGEWGSKDEAPSPSASDEPDPVADNE